MEKEEREAVLKAAEQRGCVKDGLSYHLIQHWLKHRPNDDFVAAWKDLVVALAQVTTPEFLESLRIKLMGRAKAVAEVSGGFLGMSAVSKVEHETLADLEATFAGKK